MLVVGVLALWRGREPVLRVLGAFVLVTAAAYVFTPLTAAGEPGQPVAFTWNLRYLAPAVAVGLAILPCLPALRATPARRETALGGAGRGPRVHDRLARPVASGPRQGGRRRGLGRPRDRRWRLARCTRAA